MMASTEREAGGQVFFRYFAAKLPILSSPNSFRPSACYATVTATMPGSFVSRRCRRRPRGPVGCQDVSAVNAVSARLARSDAIDSGLEGRQLPAIVLNFPTPQSEQPRLFDVCKI